MSTQLTAPLYVDKLLHKTNILVVDDRPDGLLAIEAVLADEPLNIVKASSGREALERLHEQDFAAILLDVQMPIMDGFETAQRIRQFPNTRETPIIFVTAISQDHQHVYRGYESGAVDYIFKPIDDFILKSKIKIFVDLYNQKQKILEQAQLLKEMELQKRLQERRELEAENLNRYANLANAIPHIVFKTDARGKIEYLNQTWFDLYASREQLTEMDNWRALIHPEDQIKIVRHWSIRHKNNRFKMEARIKDNKGKYHWHLISMSAEVKEHALIGWLGTCIDIQDQKNKEQELRELSRNLNRSNRSLEQFAYIASHDLQEPLRKIVTFTELIRQRNDRMGSEENQYFERIYQAGYRMKSVIEDLLEYSCISKTTDALKEPLDMNALMQEVLGDLELRLAKSKGVITVGRLPVIAGNRIQTRLLFQNLLSNAIKFARPDIPPGISVTSKRLKSGAVEIHVTDNGIGFDEKYTKKIFEPFQRLHGKGTYEGTGIGLSIVRKILDHHAWEIRTSSRVGEGSTFTICIPAAHARTA